MPKLSAVVAKRLRWFHQATFGLFIHWGLYSLMGRGEWVMFWERIPAPEYAKLASQFRPRKFDADAWARSAVEAGMKYAVMTTRHHDGFCLFDSDVSEFTSVKTAARRDFVDDFVRACRKAGLKIGLYYSLVDWRFPACFEPKRHPDSAAALVAQAHAQVRELMTRYGKIDILWYDGAGVFGNTDTAGFWKSRKLNAMVRQLQPHILINNRSGLDEDFDTPEGHVAASGPNRAWEACLTIGHGAWGYQERRPAWRGTPELLDLLLGAVNGGGNLLLNVGPKPDGTFCAEEVQRLREIGRWMKINGEAIYGMERCELSGGIIGGWSRRGRVGYFHVCRGSQDTAVAPGVATPVVSAKLLGSKKKIQVKRASNHRLIFSGIGRRANDRNPSVIRVRFASPPKKLPEPRMDWWLYPSNT